MKKEYYNFIKDIMQEKGVGAIIKRKDLIKFGIKTYNPDAYSALNGTIRGNADRIIKMLCANKYLKRIKKGEYQIIKIIPLELNFVDFRNNARK